MTEDLVRGSDEWKAAWKLARCGSLGASQLADALAKTKSGWGASRANVMAQMVAERLTGIATDGFVNDAMRWGIEKEPEAKAAYSFRTDNDVTEADGLGIVRHPLIEGTHASPDGLVASDGLIECKCPNTSTHIETLHGAAIPLRYRMQMQWQMACTGRHWCDFVSFDPRMPEHMRLFVRRIGRDDAQIKSLEADVVEFLGEVDRKVDDLRKLYQEQVA